MIATKACSQKGCAGCHMNLLYVICGRVTTTTRGYEVAYHSRLTLKGQHLHEPRLAKIHQEREATGNETVLNVSC